MLTLITTTLDAARFMRRALASARAQAGAVQHIVVDGGSGDDTVAICRSDPRVELILAPGCTIYEGWNIGIERIRGEYLMFLNADDELTPDAAEQVERAFAATPEAEIVAGAAHLIGERTVAAPRLLVAAPGSRLDVHQLAVGVPAINAMAFRRSVFARHGLFETRYRVAGDRAFLFRLALSPNPPRVAGIPAILYRYHVHRNSLTLARSLEQRLRIARDHIALSRALLEGEVPASARLWLRHLRRRESAVAALRCLAAAQPAAAFGFMRSFWD